MIDSQFLLKVFTAAFATVGIEEFIKNFLKTKKTWVYALLMIPLSIGSYFSVEVLSMWVIGGLLTIGCVQICYQTIVQGFKAIIENLARRIGSGDKGAENV
ncbi:hypothetical protein [Treponema sp.]|uniref:hypothetical protein n=1 Tax=Treponema sp. TaxID=166 RepID=UPI003F0633CA